MQTIEFDLSKQDIYLVEIEKQIAAKRQFLLQRRNHLEKASRENSFLNGVKQDYQVYHQFILKQKHDQMQAMNLLDQYLNDLITSGKLTDQDIEQSKKDQREILTEIEKIKKDLASIMK